ncbi:MAG TPA: PAS domain-containing protein [Lunatimonas sp.]|nr:PAS domain-containing protein [Lunatimonas sp.]
MLVVNKVILENEVIFEHFPAFAKFILDNYLEEFTSFQIQYSREENLPLLKFFEGFTEEEFFERAFNSSRILLEAFAQNSLRKYINDSSQNYRENLIPLLQKDAVLAEDITLVSLVRRKTFRKFLYYYTSDILVFGNIMEELDRFVAVSEMSAFNVFIKIQEEKTNQMNRELRQKNEDLLEAEEIGGVGSFLWDLKTQEATFTSMVKKVFDLTESIPFNRFLENLNREDRKKVTEAIQKAYNTDGLYDCEFTYISNGQQKRVWSKGKVQFDKDGYPEKMKGTVMDISKSYLLLQQLKESEATNNQIQAITHIGNWSWDINADQVFWSDEMYRIYGLVPQSEKITLERFLSFVHPEDREQRLQKIKKSLETGIAEDYVIRVQTQDGKLKILRGKGDVRYDANQKPIQLIGSCQDITKEHRLIKEIQQKEIHLAKKNAELENINHELNSFNQVTSHDLKEPLRKIEIFANRIEEKNGTQLPQDTLEYLSKIRSSISRMKCLIEDLLNFSQTSAAFHDFESVNLNLVLEEVLRELVVPIEEKNAKISIGKMPEIWGIAFQLKQLFSNLLSNALKYSKENTNTEIEISYQLTESKQIPFFDPIAGNSYHQITIKDNGIGFDQQFSDKIFGMFQRLHPREKYSGNGIGLAICKKIMQGHGGAIYAEGIPGEGAAFFLYFRL